MKNILFALLVILVFTAGCLEEPMGTVVYQPVAATTTQGGDQLARGKQIFTTYCQGCHAETGKGLGLPNQPDFTNASFFAIKKDDVLINSITNGVAGTPMPAWKDKLTADEIKTVLAFEKSFSGQ